LRPTAHFEPLAIDSKKTEQKDDVFSLDLNNPNLNFDYVMTGNIQDLSPIKTFDDGVKTYFEFKNNNAYIPTIYAVDTNGNETELDYKIEGDFVVIDSVQMQFSLRDNGELLCIFNNFIIGY
jgi:type IV secretory pathway VirB9-like protein